jgi:hypothetical protein
MNVEKTTVLLPVLENLSSEITHTVATDKVVTHDNFNIMIVIPPACRSCNVNKRCNANHKFHYFDSYLNITGFLCNPKHP